MSIVRNHFASNFVIQVRKAIPIPARTKPYKPSRAQVEAMKRYQEAYKAVYGMIPVISFDGLWCTIRGQTARIKMKRLKELTTQLTRRVG